MLQGNLMLYKHNKCDASYVSSGVTEVCTNRLLICHKLSFGNCYPFESYGSSLQERVSIYVISGIALLRLVIVGIY
jgi:hypothetical protein